MNKFAKFGATALLAVLLTACGPDQKAEFKQVVSLDQEFAPALTAVQQKVLQAQSQQDKAALDSAVKEYFTVMDNAINKYNALNVKDAEVKAFKDKVVTVLKETVEFTKEATALSADPAAVTPEMQQKFAEKQMAVAKDAAELQKLQAELNQKFGDKK